MDNKMDDMNYTKVINTVSDNPADFNPDNIEFRNAPLTPPSDSHVENLEYDTETTINDQEKLTEDNQSSVTEANDDQTNDTENSIPLNNFNNMSGMEKLVESLNGPNYKPMFESITNTVTAVVAENEKIKRTLENHKRALAASALAIKILTFAFLLNTIGLLIFIIYTAINI